MKRWLAGLPLALAAAAPAPAAAATLDVPGSIAPREVLAAVANGLEPGARYGLILRKGRGDGTDCTARIAVRVAGAAGSAVFSGSVPRRLPCDLVSAARQPEPPTNAEIVTPGEHYQLLVCVPAGGDCAERPVARRRVIAVRPGTSCPLVVFTPNSDHGAFELRARNASCATATTVARGASDGDRSYERAGFACVGVFDPAGLPKTVYRCTRPGARITFVAS